MCPTPSTSAVGHGEHSCAAPSTVRPTPHPPETDGAFLVARSPRSERLTVPTPSITSRLASGNTWVEDSITWHAHLRL
jgi:hypothetical protein